MLSPSIVIALCFLCIKLASSHHLLYGFSFDVDFYLSDAQQEHALAVEQLVPRLLALRIELCPTYMSEARFWEIYFVLLHPRLDNQDAKLLSTPQVRQAHVPIMIISFLLSWM